MRYSSAPGADLLATSPEGIPPLTGLAFEFVALKESSLSSPFSSQKVSQGLTIETTDTPGIFACSINPREAVKSQFELRAALVDTLGDRVRLDQYGAALAVHFESRLLSAGEPATSRLNTDRTLLEPFPDGSYALAAQLDPEDIAPGDLLAIHCEVVESDALDLTQTAADPAAPPPRVLAHLEGRIAFRLGGEGGNEGWELAPEGVAAAPLFTSPKPRGGRVMDLRPFAAGGSLGTTGGAHAFQEEEESSEPEQDLGLGAFEEGTASEGTEGGAEGDELVNRAQGHGRGIEGVPSSPPPRFTGYGRLPSPFPSPGGGRLRLLGSPHLRRRTGGGGSPKGPSMSGSPLPPRGAQESESDEELPVGASSGGKRAVGTGALGFLAAATGAPVGGPEELERHTHAQPQASDQEAKESDREMGPATPREGSAERESWQSWSSPRLFLGLALAVVVTAVSVTVWFAEIVEVLGLRGLSKRGKEEA